ncbi:hypothetical protein ACTS9M_07070 [Empedobacter sp. ULE_I136]
MAKRIIKSIVAFIPESLDLDKLLKENPPEFNYHVDNFKYLLTLMYENYDTQKYDDYGDIYTNLNAQLLQRRIRNYREHLDYLKKHNIIYENKQYIPGVKSRGFSFHNIFGVAKIKEVLITNQKLISKINKFYYLDDKNEIKLLNDELNIDYITKWLNPKYLKIDCAKAEQYLYDLADKERLSEKIRESVIQKFKKNKKLYNQKDIEKGVELIVMNKFNCRLRVLKLFNKGIFNQIVDNTAGRLHTTLTQLKGDLRQFITFKNENLVAIDIVNSQPYLSYSLLNEESFVRNNISEKVSLLNPRFNTSNYLVELTKLISKNTSKDDVLNFIEVIKSGKLYEEFGKILINKRIMVKHEDYRKEAKTIIFSSFFSKNQAKIFNKEIQIFEKEFPSVYQIFKTIKIKKHNALACLLQNLEAELVLHKACKIIAKNRPDIPIFTLHDAIITTESNKEYVYSVLHEVLTKNIGIEPTIKYEPWV